eukprot:m.779692 g.779692  ORF g.779692 m.779692 type:complete len:60 (-) comp59135_c0_seq5:148-327(-)
MRNIEASGCTSYAFPFLTRFPINALTAAPTIIHNQTHTQASKQTHKQAHTMRFAAPTKR